MPDLWSEQAARDAALGNAGIPAGATAQPAAVPAQVGGLQLDLTAAPAAAPPPTPELVDGWREAIRRAQAAQAPGIAGVGPIDTAPPAPAAPAPGDGGAPVAFTAAAPATQGVAPAAESAPLSLREQWALAAQGMGRGPSRGALNAAAGAAKGEMDKAEAARQERVAGLQSAADDAYMRGQLQATEQLGLEDSYRQQAEFYQAQQVERKAQYDQAMQGVKQAEAEYAATLKSRQPAESVGSQVMAALAIFLSGGMALGPVMSAIDRRAKGFREDKATQLEGQKTLINARNQFADRIQELTKSDTAAYNMQRASLMEQAGMQAQRYATLSGSAEKQAAAKDLAAQLNQQAAEARALAASQAYAALQKQGAGGLTFDKWLDQKKKELGVIKQADELAGGAKQKDLPADAQKKIGEYDAAEIALNQLEQQVQAYAARGNTALPGQERLLREPGAKIARGFAALTGAGNSDTAGMDPEEGNLTGNLDATASAVSKASSGVGANQEAEFQRAKRNMVGNGTVEGTLQAIERQRELLRAQRANLLVQHGAQARDVATQASIPGPGGAGAPTAGARRAGR